MMKFVTWLRGSEAVSVAEHPLTDASPEHFFVKLDGLTLSHDSTATLADLESALSAPYDPDHPVPFSMFELSVGNKKSIRLPLTDIPTCLDWGLPERLSAIAGLNLVSFVVFPRDVVKMALYFWDTKPHPKIRVAAHWELMKRA